MSSTANCKILIVEDEMLIAADLSMQLAKLGYDVLGIHTRAEDALKTLESTRPDIILMDIILSGKMNGITAATEILDAYKIPVIFLTSNVDDATFQKAKAAKPYAFISKPFRKDDLVRAIEITLERIQEEDSRNNNNGNFETGGNKQGDEVSALDDRLFVRFKDELVKVDIQDILYLEADRNYCKIQTSERYYLVSVPMGNIEKHLPEEIFLRTHRSFVVNIKKVSSINEHHEFLTIDTSTIPISRRTRDKVVRRFKMI